MVRGEAGGLVRFSALDGAEDLAMFRQGELLQARLADKIEVELDKPSKQRLAETRENRVASDEGDAVVKSAIRSQERVRIETGSLLLGQDRVDSSMSSVVRFRAAICAIVISKVARASFR